MAFELIGDPTMILRGEDMQLRAVSTARRHKAMLVVPDETRRNASQFKCTYHARTYALAGQLKTALYTKENRSSAKDKEKICLPEYPLEI